MRLAGISKKGSLRSQRERFDIKMVLKMECWPESPETHEACPCSLLLAAGEVCKGRVSTAQQ